MKDAPGYFNIVKDPIDLSIMKGKTKRRHYVDLSDFRDDINLLVTNAETYNGPNHVVTELAKELGSLAAKLIKEKSLDTFELPI